MNEYAITRRDSMADTNGRGRHSAITMGIVQAIDHKAAMSRAYELFNCNEYQWLEADNVKRIKPAKVNAARRVMEYQL